MKEDTKLFIGTVLSVLDKYQNKNLSLGEKTVKSARILHDIFINLEKGGVRNSSFVNKNYYLLAASKIASTAKLAEAIPDQRGKSYTEMGDKVSDTAKNIKLPPPSKFETYQECVKDLTSNYHVDSQRAFEYCKSVNSDNTGPSEPKGGMSRKEYVQNKVNSGSSLSQALADADHNFPTDKNRPSIKQASSKVPYYAKIQEYQDMGYYETPKQANIKSGKLQDNPGYAYLVTSEHGVMKNNPNLEAAIERKNANKNIKQASTKSDKPSWLITSEHIKSKLRGLE